MRVGIDARFLDRDCRGMGRYVRSMVGALERQENTEIVLWSDPDRDRAEVDVCWCPWGRADLTLPGAAVVVTIHDLAPIVMPRPGVFRALDRRHDRRRVRDAAARADWVVTVSAFARQEIVTHLGADPARIVAIPEGVSPAFFGTPGARRGGPVLWVGTDDERKNLPRLLDAFTAIRRRRRDVQLVLCGDNPNLVDRHRRAIGALGPGAVEVTGYLSDDELMARYRTARLFVYPSLYEGFGLPVLEAMAAGTPVVCSNAASLPEVAGDAAAYFDPTDVGGMTAAIERCLDDDAWCATLAARGQARARTFTWEAAAARLLTVFERSSCTTPAS